MAAAPDQNLDVALASGASRPLGDWLTTFPLVLAVVDPYTHESAWILPTVKRIFDGFRGADCRIAWVATADANGAKLFLGPLAESFLTFVDPDRTLVKSLGLSTLPALVALRQDGSVLAAAEGWDPTTWRDVAGAVATFTSWSRPLVPAKGDPVAYPGTPALG